MSKDDARGLNGDILQEFCRKKKEGELESNDMEEGHSYT